uniref:MutS-related protein n=1 Tax=Alicyclobacillus acidiphilus TaxID=182455 RepID=UPI001FE1DE64|nr:hypothetical protein [Alicyclobacillus acidiphilus]
MFKDIFVDIGDGQSIEGALSTFSAHVANVNDILRGAGPKSLLLLDELASGTDPGEGIGLSIALLERLYASGSTIVATTHFNEIKRFAAAAPGFENARMEFDTETLQPLYRLRIGEAGESYALVIAERLGVPKEIVHRAREIAQGTGLAPQGLEQLVKVHTVVQDEGVSGRIDATDDHVQTAEPAPREELYPNIEQYDLDIVLEPKDVRSKRKMMEKGHVEGLSIDHPAGANHGPMRHPRHDNGKERR